MNAIAGGGMLLGFPVLLAVGLPPLTANITANLVTLPGQLTSAFAYRSFIFKLHRIYLVLLIPCIVGAAIGAVLLRLTPSDKFQELVPGLIFFAFFLSTFQPFLQHHLQLHIKGKHRLNKRLLLVALALLPTAIYGGYFGAGFGFIMLAFLSFADLHDIHQMNGLKNIGAVAISSTCIVILYGTHLIDWRIGLTMAAGNAIGGYTGAHFSQRFSSHAIRIVVIIIGFCSATYLAYSIY
jgi:uncharacterized membrane protein YfcA